jgi:beta-galactosidase
LPILDGGYSLQYTPLLEHHDGKGLVIFCQMDVTGRTESDPAADLLARNLLHYVATWKPFLSRSVVYEGGEEGRSYLHSVSVPFVDYRGDSLAEDKLLIVGPGATQKLNADKILALGLEGSDLSLFTQVKNEVREHISTYFKPFEPESPFAGISPAEVHNRSPRNVALIMEGAPIVGDGVLAGSPSSNVIFSQLAPWQFQYSSDEMNVKRTSRKVAVMTARLLGNLGVSPPTSFLSHFARPVSDNEKRWLDGLYLDVPEEWDDPYRFFRW